MKYQIHFEVTYLKPLKNGSLKCNNEKGYIFLNTDDTINDLINDPDLEKQVTQELAKVLNKNILQTKISKIIKNKQKEHNHA